MSTWLELKCRHNESLVKLWCTRGNQSHTEERLVVDAGALVPSAININRSHKVAPFITGHIYFPTFIISLRVRCWVFSREALRATICNKDGHWLNMGVPRTKDFLLAKKNASPVHVCYFIPACSLSRQRCGWFLQTEEQRVQRERKENLGVMAKVFWQGRALCAVWFSHESSIMQQLQHQCLFMIHLATYSGFNNHSHSA